MYIQHIKKERDVCPNCYKECYCQSKELTAQEKAHLPKISIDALHKQQFPVVATQEPGKTAFGKIVRTIVQEKKVPICSKAEYLLFAADRAQHFEEFIIPHLAEKQLIISDRMADSSIVYQGYGRGLDVAVIQFINEWTMCSLKPQLTLYVRLCPEVACERIAKRNEALTSFEKEKRDFIHTLSNGFDIIFNNKPHVIVLDGTQNPEVLQSQATEKIITWLQSNNLILKKN